jgi:hypothetical protein
MVEREKMALPRIRDQLRSRDRFHEVVRVISRDPMIRLSDPDVNDLLDLRGREAP